MRYLLFLISCAAFAGDPLVGTWSLWRDGTELRLEFRADGTCATYRGTQLHTDRCWYQRSGDTLYVFDPSGSRETRITIDGDVLKAGDDLLYRLKRP